MSAVDAVVARRMHRTLEAFHGFVYLVPEADEEYLAAGVTSGRMGYFASRSAPMGPVPAEVVIATFYNFSPALVRRSIPAAWSLVTPAELLAARLRVVDRVLRRVLGDEALAGPEVGEALSLAREAGEACQPVGRPLYAGHASLPWPEEGHLALWHAVTLLREYRGDGHIAALTAAGYSGCEAIVTHVASGELPRAFAASRAWTDDEWAAAEDGLRGRGLMDASGALTDAGRASRQWVEDRTDELAMAPWERLGDERCRRLRHLVRPWSKALAAAFTQWPGG